VGPAVSLAAVTDPTPSPAPNAVQHPTQHLDLGVRSEVGRLETVLVHRPGRELQRLTPRNNDALLFDDIPWVGRAQEEHDAFAETMTAHGVEVLYLVDLLTAVLEQPAARGECIDSVLSDRRHGDTLRETLRAHLAGLHPEDLVSVLIGGLAHEELGAGQGLRYTLMDTHDFVIDPLPNLLFTRDSSTWIGDRIALTSLATAARARETALTKAVFTHHERFAGTGTIYEPSLEPLEGGDVLQLAPGVLAVGVGERTSPAGVERLARNTFRAGLVHTVLAVPIAQERATMHLDTMCTMVDTDTVLMYPNVVDELQAYPLTPDADGVPQVGRRESFFVAAAAAMGIERLRLIETGLDPVTAEREQWDDGNNTLALAPRLAVAYERNTETNARLERAGIDVLPIAGSELGSGRGGPRCMSSPVRRSPSSESLNNM